MFTPTLLCFSFPSVHWCLVLDAPGPPPPLQHHSAASSCSFGPTEGSLPLPLPPWLLSTVTRSLVLSCSIASL